jgi:hypothetical protein
LTEAVPDSPKLTETPRPRLKDPFPRPNPTPTDTFGFKPTLRPNPAVPLILSAAVPFADTPIEALWVIWALSAPLALIAALAETEGRTMPKEFVTEAPREATTEPLRPAESDIEGLEADSCPLSAAVPLA